MSSSHMDAVDYLNSKSSNESLSTSNTSLSYLMAERANETQRCQTEAHYLPIERICYLYLMCPIAFFGILINLITLKVFYKKSFNSVTFKYIRLITWTDFFICIVIIPYCLTAYTSAFNSYDFYMRNIYLAYAYIPGANIAICLASFLNLLVTIERLVSVGAPTRKHTLFKPSRYRLSCLIVVGLAFLFNLANFFIYSVDKCDGLRPNSFTSMYWWLIYGYIKEIVTRIMPIIFLVIGNIILVCIVRSSRRRMGRGRSKRAQSSLMNQEASTVVKTDFNSEMTTFVDNGKPKSTMSNSVQAKLHYMSSKRSRQDNQLTWMTIVVAIVYTVTTIPMVFAYPGIIFSGSQLDSRVYKIYAIAVNILELLQCSLRFFIYFCFTTQFRVELYILLRIRQPPNPNFTSQRDQITGT